MRSGADIMTTVDRAYRLLVACLPRDPMGLPTYSTSEANLIELF